MCNNCKGKIRILMDWTHLDVLFVTKPGSHVLFFPTLTGTEEERKVVQFVNRFCKVKQKQNIYKKDLKPEVELDTIVPTDEFIGDDIEVGVLVKNVSDSDKNVKVHLTMASTFYTGVVGKKVQGEKTEHLVKAGEG